jgi:hypothetical protein
MRRRRTRPIRGIFPKRRSPARTADTPATSGTPTRTVLLSASAPGAPGFDSSLGKWQHIGTRAQDPQPLTLEQLFPPRFELNGSLDLRTATSLTKNCSLAVFGPDLQAALQEGHCTQVLRASYISGDNAMMGTVGIANLISSAAALKAGQKAGPEEIIAPLPTPNGDSTGVVQASPVEQETASAGRRGTRAASSRQPKFFGSLFRFCLRGAGRKPRLADVIQKALDPARMPSGTQLRQMKFADEPPCRYLTE